MIRSRVKFTLNELSCRDEGIVTWRFPFSCRLFCPRNLWILIRWPEKWLNNNRTVLPCKVLGSLDQEVWRFTSECISWKLSRLFVRCDAKQFGRYQHFWGTFCLYLKGSSYCHDSLNPHLMKLIGTSWSCVLHTASFNRNKFDTGQVYWEQTFKVCLLLGGKCCRFPGWTRVKTW